jgi:hypothetical protein
MPVNMKKINKDMEAKIESEIRAVRNNRSFNMDITVSQFPVSFAGAMTLMKA